MLTRCLSVLGLAVGLALTSSTVRSEPIEIQDFLAFITSTEIAAEDPAGTGFASLEDDGIGGRGVNEFETAGLTAHFVDELEADSTGSVAWLVTNHSGRNLTNTKFFGFLDAEIGEVFDDEYGTRIGVSGSGPGDVFADSWEIDEPGIAFGDIFDNLLAGMLDNTNSIPKGTQDDVSLALGFELGTLAAGETILAEFTISDENIGDLRQTDVPTDFSFNLDGTVSVFPDIYAHAKPAPAMGPWGMLGLVFAILATVLSRLHRRVSIWHTYS